MESMSCGSWRAYPRFGQKAQCTCGQPTTGGPCSLCHGCSQYRRFCCWWPYCAWARGTRFAFGRLCVVMLLDGDPCALECSASPRAAGGACLPLRLSLRGLPGLTLLWLQQGSCCTTVRHLFPSGYGQESLHASLQAESAPRAQADTCAPSIGRPVCALCERGTVALD